ncbi:hypothetical protein [Hwanghaeella sp.]|uniref:hypothetical protein n=1 Tax=Hwanghaeella sp. TaxID=2605943 RepID=UPI003CCC3851
MVKQKIESRRLTKTEAITLTGWPEDIFDKKVAEGLYPRPIVSTSPNRKRPVVRYDRKALERAMDHEAGIHSEELGPDPMALLDEWYSKQ